MRGFTVCIVLFWIGLSFGSQDSSLEIIEPKWEPPPELMPKPVAVLYNYVFSRNSDSENNLKYFLQGAVKENDIADYYFLIDGYLSIKLPDYQNVFTFYLEKEKQTLHIHNQKVDGNYKVTFRFTSFGELIERIGINKLKQHYDHFVFISSDVRGPFLPMYYTPHWATEDEKKFLFHWTRPFTERLNDEVKLVSSAIYCINYKKFAIENSFFVTDGIGLDTLIDKQVFLLTEPMERSIAVPSKILKAGFNMACPVTPMSNIDWREEVFAQECNDYRKVDEWFYNMSIHPFETIFVRNLTDPYVIRYSYWHQEPIPGTEAELKAPTRFSEYEEITGDYYAKNKEFLNFEAHYEHHFLQT